MKITKKKFIIEIADVSDIAILMIITFIITSAFWLKLCYNEEVQGFKTEVLDKLCKEKFGVDYSWIDCKFGPENDICCHIPDDYGDWFVTETLNKTKITKQDLFVTSPPKIISSKG